MTARTSEIYPLIINEVLVPGCPGAIGITFCPGKKDRHSNTGIWERDLEADMESIRAWGTTCLVTLMEDHEFDQLGVRQLPFKAQEVGLTWFHIPIPDVSIPDFRFHERWSGIGLRLMNVLLAGERPVWTVGKQWIWSGRPGRVPSRPSSRRLMCGAIGLCCRSSVRVRVLKTIPG